MNYFYNNRRNPRTDALALLLGRFNGRTTPRVMSDIGFAPMVDTPVYGQADAVDMVYRSTPSEVEAMRNRRLIENERNRSVSGITNLPMTGVRPAIERFAPAQTGITNLPMPRKRPLRDRNTELQSRTDRLNSLINRYEQTRGF